MKRNENLLTKGAFAIERDYSPIRKDNNRGIYVAKVIKSVERPIYRYIEFEYLVQMLETKELFIPNRQRFSDLREHSENNKKTISEARNTFRTVPAYRNRRIFRECEDRQMQIWNQAVSCWTYDSHRVSENSEELDENYVMWASHIIKKSVCRIRSTIKRFSSSIINLSHDIIISDVKYKPVARRHFANISEDIFIKPDFYMDEDEIRFVVLQNERFASDNQNDVVLSINPFELIDEITISPFISREEE